MRTFEQAKAFAPDPGLKGEKQWREYCKSSKKPRGTPSNPDKAYKSKGWVDLGGWLGTGRIANKKKEYWPCEQARKFVHNDKPIMT